MATRPAWSLPPKPSRPAQATSWWEDPSRRQRIRARKQEKFWRRSGRTSSQFSVLSSQFSVPGLQFSISLSQVFVSVLSPASTIHRPHCRMSRCETLREHFAVPGFERVVASVSVSRSKAPEMLCSSRNCARSSPEGAEDISPGRKPWVRCPKNVSPVGTAQTVAGVSPQVRDIPGRIDATKKARLCRAFLGNSTSYQPLAISHQPPLKLLVKFASRAGNINPARDTALAILGPLHDPGIFPAFRASGGFAGVHDLLTVRCLCDLRHILLLTGLCRRPRAAVLPGVR